MWKTIISKFSPYIIIGIMCVALWQTYNQGTLYHDRASALETTISDLNQEIKRAEIRLNDSISVYQAEVKHLNVTQGNLKAKYDKLLTASKTRPKDVNSVTEMASVVHSRDTVIAVVDTFGGITAVLKDPFVSIDVEVSPDRTTIIDYEMRDSLTLLNVQKKHSWLFGLIKWTEYKNSRLINHNPKASIVSLQTIDIIE